MIRRGIGLLGGTFDPVHTGHLALAAEAIRALSLSRVEFVPAGNPWQKGDVSSAEHRVRMLELAIASNSDFSLNLTEVLREGATYTIDTLQTMRQRVGPSMPLVLLIGFDQWANLTTWKRWTELLDFASIAVCSRDGVTEGPVASELESWARGKWTDPTHITQFASGALTRFTFAPHAASSSKIRQALREGVALQTLEPWLTESTLPYILQHHLYGTYVTEKQQ